MEQARRAGSQHQAGSDAQLTLLCYHELCLKFPSNKIPKKYVNRVFGIGQDAHVYNRSNTNFTNDSMNNYMYTNNQAYFYPQGQHNPMHQAQMYNFNMMTPMDASSYFMPMQQDYFMYANQQGHQ